MSETIYNYYGDEAITLHYDSNPCISIGDLKVHKHDFLAALERLLDITVIDNRDLPMVTLAGDRFLLDGVHYSSGTYKDNLAYSMLYLAAAKQVKMEEDAREREEQLDILEELCQDAGIDVLNRDAIRKLYDEGGLRKQ